jgi:hypothetical protein
MRYRLTTFRYGLMAQYNFNPKFGLTLELNQEARGFYPPNTIYRYNYLPFPLIWQYRFGKYRNVTLEFGTHLAIKTSGNRTIAETGQVIFYGLECPACDNGRFDWGLIVGAGYRHTIVGNISAFIAGRLNVSQISAENRPFGSYTHYAYSGVLGITYGLGKP